MNGLFRNRADEHPLSRRSFLAGAVGMVAASCAAPLALSGCSRESKDDEIDVLTVAENQVITLDAFTSLKETSRYCKVQNVKSYDAGTTLYTTGTKVAAALCTGKTASPLSTIALVDLATGKMNNAVGRAQQAASGFEILSARASDELLVWVESNFLTSEWAVYSAAIDTKKLEVSKPVQIDMGNAQFDAPDIAAINGNAYWIVQPAEDGDMTDEDSLLKVSSGGSAASVIFTSHGRFNGGLSVSGDVLTAMPRADSSQSVYYQMTAFQDGTGSVIASQVLPRSYRPGSAIYLGGSFAFSIPASYDYGGGISLVGTYYPMPDGQWLRLTRQPVTPPGLCQGWLYCKSGSRTVFVNCERRAYFVVDAPDGCADYGDYSIANGEVASVYNYATITKSADSGEKSTVQLRHLVPRKASEVPITEDEIEAEKEAQRIAAEKKKAEERERQEREYEEWLAQQEEAAASGEGEEGDGSESESYDEQGEDYSEGEEG